MAKSNVVLVSPDGKREWVPEDKIQEVNLKAKGWKEKPAKKQGDDPANKSVGQPANKSKK